MTVRIFPDDWGHPNTPFWIVSRPKWTERSRVRAMDMTSTTTDLQEVGLPVFTTRLCAGDVYKTNLQNVSIFTSRMHVDGVFSVCYSIL